MPVVVSPGASARTNGPEQYATQNPWLQDPKREVEAYIVYADVKAAEERLRAEYGSPRHLLLAFAALTEPVRGGDLGRVRVCSAGAAPATGNYIEPPAGAAGKTTVVLRNHKTAHAAKVGTLVRVLPLW